MEADVRRTEPTHELCGIPRAQSRRQSKCQRIAGDGGTWYRSCPPLSSRLGHGPRPSMTDGLALPPIDHGDRTPRLERTKNPAQKPDTDSDLENDHRTSSHPSASYHLPNDSLAVSGFCSSCACVFFITQSYSLSSRSQWIPTEIRTSSSRPCTRGPCSFTHFNRHTHPRGLLVSGLEADRSPAPRIQCGAGVLGRSEIFVCVGL